MLFYTRWVWVIQGIQGFALFLLGAYISRTVVGGFLSTLMFSHIRPFATRAFFTVSLRENFAMPFFWLRILFLTIMFRSKLKENQLKMCLVALSFSTFCFSSSWQLSPFILFAQGLSLYGGAMLNALNMRSVESVLGCDAIIVFIVGILHFGYPLFCLSPAIFCSALVILSNKYYPPKPANQRRFIPVVMRCLAILFGGVFLSTFMKSLFGAADDNHVGKLFLAKLNLAYHHDFDVNMYLASSVFRALPLSFFVDMTAGAFLLVPIYCICHLVFLLGILLVFEETTTTTKPLGSYEKKKKDDDAKEEEEKEENKEKKGNESNNTQPSLLAYLLLRRPELTMNALISVPMALLGMFIQRLQLLWTPHMCIFYTWVISTPAIYTLIPLPGFLKRWVPRICRYVVPTFVILVICSGYLPAIRQELSFEYRQRFQGNLTSINYHLHLLIVYPDFRSRCC